MPGEAREQQIFQKLKTIDQYTFEHMVNNLLYQGAFPEIAKEGTVIGQFGINLLKRRTRKSAPRTDAEVRTEGLAIEYSVQENWSAKLIEVLRKNKGNYYTKFGFFTNQDTESKLISIDGQLVDAESYCSTELGCDFSWVVGLKELEPPMLNPKFFNIRRNFLNIDGDYFCSAATYSEILSGPQFGYERTQEELEKYASIIQDRILFDSHCVVLLHNHDYMTLLHAVGAWASREMKEETDGQDICFIKWPQQIMDTSRIDPSELSKFIPTFLIVWGAGVIENLNELLRFAASNIMLILVTNTELKDTVRSRIDPHHLGAMQIKEVSIKEIDERTAEPGEKQRHQEKVEVIAKELVGLMLKFEALLYFYSPFMLDDARKLNRVMKILQIDKSAVSHLGALLIENELAAVTGQIIWLKQPLVAKDLLKNYLDNGDISIDDLMAG
jgi:hypothetical protein